jgi:hypothetical protein
MNDPDGNHRSHNATQEMTQEESEDPGSRHSRLATGDTIGRRSIRA